MRLRTSAIAAAMMLIALLLEGCATPPSVPENLKYKEPAGSVEAGSVLGSQVGRLLEDDETAFVIGVDGLQVIIGRDGWNKPLRIAPGARQIAVAFIKGGYRCYAVMPLDVSSDATYRVRHTTDMGFFGGTYCDFWIENEESKKPVGRIVRAKMTLGDGGYVPIYIPRK